MLNNASNRTLLIILAILAIVFIGFEHHKIGDLAIYLDAARDLIAGKNIYRELYGDDRVFLYMGSPTLAFLLYPLSLPHFMVASAIWKVLNLFFLFRIWKLLETCFSGYSLSNRQANLFLVFSFSTMLFLVYRNFHLGQFTFFLLFVILESINQARRHKFPVYGITLLGLGMIAKLLPLVTIPYLIYRGYRNSILYLFAVLIILIMLPAVYLGWEHNLLLNREWLLSINPMNQHNVFDVSTRTIHGIAALISTLTIEGIGNPYSLDIKRNILNLNPELVRYLILAAKLVLIAGTLFFLRYQRIFSDHKNPLYRLWELSYILLITPLVFPQQRSYAFFFIFPPMVYLIFGLLINRENRKAHIMVLFGLSILLLNLDLLLGHFREYYWHFKTLTYGVLIMLGLLIWMSPKRIGSANLSND